MCTHVFNNSMTFFRSRGIASGVAAAVNYIFGFISKKTYYNVETTLSLPGASLLYCFICGFGLIFTYIVLPETEGRTLEEIELHFSDNSKSITDRKIAKFKSKTNDKQLNGNHKAIEMAYENKAFENDNSKV